MKPISIKLDKLLANTSLEQVRGKLILVSADHNRIILELKSKQVKTILGPFEDANWDALAQKEVVVFLKPGEKSAVYPAKAQLREKATSSRSTSANNQDGRTTSRSTKSEPARKGPLVKWSKFAEGRMVGEPVKLVSIVKGFDIELPFLEALLAHLEIAVGQNTKVIAYLDFRKLYHFMCGPEFRAFESAYLKR